MTIAEVAEMIGRDVRESACGCWIVVPLGNSRYPRAVHDGRRASAARIVLEQHVARPLRADEVVGHSCGLDRCVRPDHLRVTSRSAIAAALPHIRAMRERTHCNRGHELTPENTMRRRDGSRACRTCAQADVRARWQARRAAV